MIPRIPSERHLKKLQIRPLVQEERVRETVVITVVNNINRKSDSGENKKQKLQDRKS